MELLWTRKSKAVKDLLNIWVQDSLDWQQSSMTEGFKLSIKESCKSLMDKQVSFMGKEVIYRQSNGFWFAVDFIHNPQVDCQWVWIDFEIYPKNEERIKKSFQYQYSIKGSFIHLAMQS